MTNNLTRTLLTAAVMTLGAGAAYSQPIITVNIPFAFRSTATMEPSGTYVISRLNNTLVLRNQATGEAKFTAAAPVLGNSKDGEVKLVFRCGSATGCALSEVWGADGIGRLVPTPKLKADETERVAVVYADHSTVAPE